MNRELEQNPLFLLDCVKDEIEAISGRMWVENEPGSGTTVWLRFPVKPFRPDDGSRI